MKAVQDDPDRLVISPPNNFPCVSVIADVTAPRQRLKSDTHTPCVGSLAQFAKIVGGAIYSAERNGRDIAANEQQIVPSSCMRSNFLSILRKPCARWGSGIPSKSRKG